MPDTVKSLFLFSVPVLVLFIGSYYQGGSEGVKEIIRVIAPFFGFISLYVGAASLSQKYVFDKLDVILRDYAARQDLSFTHHGYYFLANPGVGSTVKGEQKSFDVSMRGNFHGYQLGRKSFVVEVAGIQSSKMLFSSNKHKFPKLDFWNAGKIPSFSSFLCERGPLVKLKNAYVLELPTRLKKTHYLVAEDNAYASAMLEKNTFDYLSTLAGAVYLDGGKLYYGQSNLPHSTEEVKAIVDPLIKFASKIEKK